MVFVVALTIALLYTKSARSTMFCVKSNRWYVRVLSHILWNVFIISTNTEMAVSLLHAIFRSEFVRPKFAFLPTVNSYPHIARWQCSRWNMLNLHQRSFHSRYALFIYFQFVYDFVEWLIIGIMFRIVNSYIATMIFWKMLLVWIYHFQTIIYLLFASDLLEFRSYYCWSKRMHA